jgi:hypothetical protein
MLMMGCAAPIHFKSSMRGDDDHRFKVTDYENIISTGDSSRVFEHDR